MRIPFLWSHCYGLVLGGFENFCNLIGLLDTKILLLDTVRWIP